MKNTQTALTQQIKGRGWETIAGNGELKDNLNLWFIQKIAVEQGGNKVNFPNSILFYGPQSTGKTRIAKALAQQSQCNYREIDMAFRDNIAKELEEIKKESLDIYKTKGLRTLILMDEFDSATQLTRKEKNLWTSNDEGSNIIYHKCLDEKDEASYVAKEVNKLNLENLSSVFFVNNHLTVWIITYKIIE
mgnify:CR=1 FL=1